MLVCTDVDYREGGSARAAALVFRDWSDAAPLGEWALRVDGVQPYRPGEFYRRELPCLLAVLEKIIAAEGTPEAVVIDGYVTLDAAGTPGLGAHLYAALDCTVPVIGVAKTAFRGSAHARAVCRGGSRSPLYLTAIGTDAAQAARSLQQMAGPHRIPALLKRVDGLCRSAP
jgi:deoxyribonuclease V